MTAAERERVGFDVARYRALERATGEPLLADRALSCIECLEPEQLLKLLRVGVMPGEVNPQGYTLLSSALAVCDTPYAQTSVARPYAMASLALLLHHVQPDDWLVPAPRGSRGDGSYPLLQAAAICDPATSAAVLDAIINSPGGFPVHAVVETPDVLHQALVASSA